ncbi:MAG: sigma-70 family RNA polymerase sigma factor [Chloroflexota bacterium]|nr:sigma-70 family RNA polymerase sigma factor [Chloroflexota bacterium]
MKEAVRAEPETGFATMTDEQLARLALRQRDAFGELYLRYADRIFRYAAGRTGSRTVADDVLNDTMVGALEGLHRYDSDKGSFASWLFTIASRRIADHARRRVQLWRFLDRRGANTIDDDLLDALIRAEDQEHIRLAVQRLPKRQREIVLLRYVAELSFRDVARVLGVSEGAARMRVNRALHRLAEEIGVIDAE